MNNKCTHNSHSFTDSFYRTLYSLCTSLHSTTADDPRLDESSYSHQPFDGSFDHTQLFTVERFMFCTARLLVNPQRLVCPGNERRREQNGAMYSRRRIYSSIKVNVRPAGRSHSLSFSEWKWKFMYLKISTNGQWLIILCSSEMVRRELLAVVKCWICILFESEWMESLSRVWISLWQQEG